MRKYTRIMSFQILHKNGMQQLQDYSTSYMYLHLPYDGIDVLFMLYNW